MSLKDPHLYGVGAAACAVCCVPPLLTVLGVSGTAAAIATFAFAGVVFGLAVAAGTALAVTQQRRRRRRRESSIAADGPVDIDLAPTRSGGAA